MSAVLRLLARWHRYATAAVLAMTCSQAGVAVKVGVGAGIKARMGVRVKAKAGAEQKVYDEAALVRRMLEQRVELLYGRVAIGEPPQNFTVAFDTGSSELLLPCADCSDGSCISHARYDLQKSSTGEQIWLTDPTTGENSPEIQRRQFGLRGIAVAEAITDRICLNDELCVPQETPFLCAKSLTENLFLQLPYDGILGLGLSGKHRSKFDVFRTFTDAGMLKHDRFALWYPDFTDTTSGGGGGRGDNYQAPQITFGSHDKSRMMSQMYWIPVPYPAERWELPMSDIVVGAYVDPHSVMAAATGASADAGSEGTAGTAGAGSATSGSGAEAGSSESGASDVETSSSGKSFKSEPLKLCEPPQKCRVVFDSASPLLVMSQPVYDRVKEAIAVGYPREPVSDTELLDCQPLSYRMPKIGLQFRGITFFMDAEDYVDQTGGTCVFRFQPMESDEFLVYLGRPWFEKYYTVFDRDSLKVGISLSKHENRMLDPGNYIEDERTAASGSSSSGGGGANATAAGAAAGAATAAAGEEPPPVAEATSASVGAR